MNTRSHSVPGFVPQSGAECTTHEVDVSAVSRVSSALPTPARAARVTAIFSALADPTRFRILNALALEELCVCDLAEIAGVSQSGASHQLRLLRDCGLVAFRRDANRAVYRLADDHVRTLLAQGLAHADEGDEAS